MKIYDECGLVAVADSVVGRVPALELWQLWQLELLLPPELHLIYRLELEEMTIVLAWVERYEEK